jgi:Protein of unknown function (DUF1579)
MPYTLGVLMREEEIMKKVVVVFVVAIGLMCLGLTAFAQQPKGQPAQPKAAPPPPAAKAPPQMTPEQKAMMEKMQAAATPGAPHKFLAQMEGTWKADSKWWQDPKAPPAVSVGTSENKMILGGRFLQQTYHGESEMGPFDGVGYWGFDNVQKKFQGTWIDSMGTGMMLGHGELDKTGKILTTAQTYADPETGKVETYKIVVNVVDQDKHVMQMYGKGKDGKECLMMEITYTRAAAAVAPPAPGPKHKK